LKLEPETKGIAMPPRQRAVIYARFSPRPNASEAESNENQIDACKEFCESKRMIVKSVWTDEAVSGSKESQSERPGLWQAMKDLSPGDALVVYKLDRIARSVFLSQTIEKMVEGNGAEILSVKNEGTWDDTPEDRALRSILQTFDQYYREANARRTADAMRTQMKSGKIMTDPKRLPFGWELTCNKEKMRPCKPEQEIIQQIREMSESGKSTGQIAKALNAAGLYPRTGKWTNTKLFRILKSNRIAYPYNPTIRALKSKRTG